MFGSNSIIFDFITHCAYLLSIFSYENDSLPQEYHVFLYTFKYLIIEKSFLVYAISFIINQFTNNCSEHFVQIFILSENVFIHENTNSLRAHSIQKNQTQVQKYIYTKNLSQLGQLQWDTKTLNLVKFHFRWDTKNYTIPTNLV